MKAVVLEEHEEDAIKKVAQMLTLSPEDKGEVVRRALLVQAYDTRFLHNLGYTRRGFARILSKLEEGLTSYICKKHLQIM